MMQIVHDLALGATRYCATGFGGLADTETNIETLRVDGCQVIIIDI